MVRVKYLIGGLAVLVGVVVAAMLIVPAVVDWNEYRAEIASQASHALGRTVEIRGDVGLALLPAPRLTVKDAHLANIEGAAAEDMISLASLEITAAWAPLLGGTVRVESVKLVRPVINIEIFEGGQSNLTFQPQGPTEARPPAAGSPPRLPATGLKVTPKVGGGFDFSVDNFVVEKGTLVFRHSARGIEERVDDLNGRIAFASLKGPMDAVATAVVHGVPLSVDLSAGEVIQGRTVQFNLDVAVVPGNFRAQFTGSLNGLDEIPRLRGKFTAEGENLQAFVSAMGAGTLPDTMRRPFGAQANMALASDAVELAELTIKLDGAQAIGRVTADLSAKPSIEAILAISRLDLDAFVRPATALSTKSTASARAKPAPAFTSSATVVDLPTDTRARPISGGGFSLESLSADLSANFALTIEAITWRAEAIRQAKLDLSLANREITVSQLSALLPGSSDVAMFGFITEKDGLPQFDGAVDATTNDLRGMIDWLGVSTKGIASDRLRKLSLNAKLSVRPDIASVSELRAHVDATQIDGALTASITSRLSLGANLSLDRLNLDAYLPSTTAEPATTAPIAGPQAASPTKEAAAVASGGANPLTALTMLAGFDANLRLRAGAVTAGGLPLNDVRIEAALLDGVLDVASASIGDMVGVTASLSGAITDLKPDAQGRLGDPKFKDVIIKASGKNLANLFRLTDIRSPVSAEALGAVAVASRLNGSLRMMDMASEVQAMGGRASVNGQLNTRDLLPRLEARVGLVHPDFARFARAFSPDYRPRSAKGGIDLEGQVVGNLFELGVNDLVGIVAGVRAKGSGAMRLPGFVSGRRPQVAIQLATGDLDLDSFLPQKRTAALDMQPSIQPASYRMPDGDALNANIIRVAANSGGAWSTGPLDLSMLAALDGSLAVKSDSLSYGGITLANADLDAELRNGVLEIRHLTGKTFGGDLTIDGGLAAEAQGGRFEARYALVGADVGAADRALDGKSTAGGNASFDGRLTGRGKSAADLVASLAGEGTLAFKGINVSGSQGLAMMGLGGVTQAMERVAGLRGRLTPIPVNISGPYRVANGVVNFDELAFASEVGEGTLKGKADLPKWQMTATGEIRLAKDFVIGDAKTAKPIPFALEGALDAPRLKVDIAALPGGGLRVPLDKLRTKEGAKEVLNGLLPRAAPKREAPTVEPLAPPTASAPSQAAPVPTPPPAVAPPPPAQAEPKKGERVEDILKGILKGVGR